MPERDEDKQPKGEANQSPVTPEKHPDDASDDRTNQIVLSLTVAGLVAAAGALAAKRLRNRGGNE